MDYQLDVVALASLVSAKRAGRPLDVVAAEIGGVSCRGLSRIEHQQQQPTLGALLHLCNWLEVPPGHFLYDGHLTLPALHAAEMFAHLDVKPAAESLADTYHRLLAESTSELEQLFYAAHG